ncbi:MAG: ATP-binding protein [Desulfarculaceae bacterium]|jgi:two-component system NtrC family sensor kinase
MTSPDSKNSGRDSRHVYQALKKKILASMILVPAAPFVLVLVVGYQYFVSSLQSETFSRMVRIAQDHKRVIEMFLAERRADLSSIADSTNLDQISQPENLRRTFNNLRAHCSAYVDLGVFDAAGNHLAYQGPYRLTGKNYKDATWFKEVLNKGHHVSNVFLGYRKVPHFVVALAIRNSGKPWVIRATIDTLFFTDLVEKVRIGKTGEAYIIDEKGRFQTERRSGGTLLENDSDAGIYLSSHEGVKGFVAQGSSGAEYIFATTWLNEGKWLLVVRQEEADAFGALHHATYFSLVVLILGGAAILAAALFLAGNIIGRMEKADQEKDRLDQQLIVAGRLAEIGEMSAGFAHEINNPLQIISAEQNLMQTVLKEMKERRELPEGADTEEVFDSLAQIRTQLERCAQITQSLLNFARPKEPSVQELDLNRFIPMVVQMVSKKAEVNGIRLRSHIQADLPPIRADAGQLQQVFLNLFNNAFDAVTERYGPQGGLVDIQAQAEDHLVSITVKDNGVGIEPQNLEKIFTPFFSTKPVGQGTGLGLSVCYGIIEKMGGKIILDSGAGKGTSFRVQLPAID